MVLVGFSTFFDLISLLLALRLLQHFHVPLLLEVLVRLVEVVVLLKVLIQSGVDFPLGDRHLHFLPVLVVVEARLSALQARAVIRLMLLIGHFHRLLLLRIGEMR